VLQEKNLVFFPLHLADAAVQASVYGLNMALDGTKNAEKLFPFLRGRSNCDEGQDHHAEPLSEIHANRERYGLAVSVC
jgi:hypothetical protein